MKHLMVSAFAICLAMAAPAAWAADDAHQGHQGQGGGHAAQQGGNHGGQQGGQPGGGHAGPQGGGQSIQHVTPTVATHAGGMQGIGQQGGGMSGAMGARSSHRTRGHNAGSGVTIGIGNQGNMRANVDIGSLRRNITAQHHYHNGDYRAPQGYAYRRWSYGDRLPSIYFARDYWLGDYENFGLMDPPYGYTWVRYGPDALLIDEDTGEVVQVVYGVFY